MIDKNTINGLRITNGGIIKQFAASDHNYYVELMGIGYSSHPYNIVATYFMDEGIKTSLVLWAGRQSGEAKLCIYKYKVTEPLQHYYSRIYNTKNIPNKYVKYAKELIRAYIIEFCNGKLPFNYPKEWGLI